MELKLNNDTLRILCNAILLQAIKDINMTCRGSQSTETMKRYRDDAREFLLSEYADDIAEAAGLSVSGKEIYAMAKYYRPYIK